MKINILKKDDRGVIYQIEDGLVSIVWKKGSKSSEHTHDTAEKVHVIKGSLKVRFNNEEHILNESECLSVPENIPRQIEALEDTIFIERT